MGIAKYIETNNNENITYQNLWNAPKAILRENPLFINAYTKKKET